MLRQAPIELAFIVYIETIDKTTRTINRKAQESFRNKETPSEAEKAHESEGVEGKGHLLGFRRYPS